ncbi:MAG: YcxB family protein [Desulfuromonadales bacterium]|nr:YcxB family protein [Desulfuromonadales bacterium]MBN2793127.1 YcxB family protein [Desulfuromonadales bacterium]
MTNAIQINHQLSEKDWRTFYGAYYAADTRFKLRFIYGTATWVIGGLGLVGLFNNKPIAFGMIAFGLYCVFAKQFLINKAIKKIKASPEFPGMIDYVIDPDKISGTTQNKAFEFTWKNFHGYRDLRPGLMFYLKPSSFFFIPTEALRPGTREEIVGLLQRAEVPNLKTQKGRTTAGQAVD